MIVSKLINILLYGSLIFSATVQRTADNDPVHWIPLAEAQETALKEDKVLFVLVEAAWYSICKRMKEDVFPRDEIRKFMTEHYVPVSIDLDSEKGVVFNGETLTEREFARMMNVMATPTMIFIRSDGKILGSHPGFVPPERFYALLKYIVSDSFGRTSFDTFLREYQRE